MWPQRNPVQAASCPEGGPESATVSKNHSKTIGKTTFSPNSKSADVPTILQRVTVAGAGFLGKHWKTIWKTMVPAKQQNAGWFSTAEAGPWEFGGKHSTKVIARHVMCVFPRAFRELSLIHI